MHLSFQTAPKGVWFENRALPAFSVRLHCNEAQPSEDVSLTVSLRNGRGEMAHLLCGTTTAPHHTSVPAQIPTTQVTPDNTRFSASHPTSRSYLITHSKALKNAHLHLSQGIIDAIQLTTLTRILPFNSQLLFSLIHSLECVCARSLTHTRPPTRTLDRPPTHLLAHAPARPLAYSPSLPFPSATCRPARGAQSQWAGPPDRREPLGASGGRGGYMGEPSHLRAFLAPLRLLPPCHIRLTPTPLLHSFPVPRRGRVGVGSFGDPSRADVVQAEERRARALRPHLADSRCSLVVRRKGMWGGRRVILLLNFVCVLEASL